MFRKMPFVLLAIIILIASLNPWIPVSFKSFLYAASLSLKSVIAFMLPFLIFGLLFKTAVQLAKKATKMILFLLLAICCSNFIAVLTSYTVGVFAYRFDLSMTLPNVEASLLPLWSFSLPKIIGNDVALFSALFLGIVLAKLRPAFAEKMSSFCEKNVGRMLKVILFIIPFFIAGFIGKMCHEGVMVYMIRDYAPIFGIVAVSVFSYIFLVYMIGNRFKASAAFSSMKNMLPAVITGFGSMSSAAAMPLTILATEKNTQNPALARSIIPATVNNHMLGDCFAIPIFAFAVMKNFGVEEPTFMSYLVFACYFVLAKFSSAGVPGGGVLVMLPVLESCLGFKSDMVSLITAIYILFDPLLTSMNILGNGGFAMGLSRIFKNRLEPQKN